MILFRAAKYLKYILLAGHRKGHGIHSPFVYDIVSRIFSNKIDRDIVLSIEKIRRKLIVDGRSLNVKDLGSGSSGMRKAVRKVSDIVRYSPVSKKYGILLANMAAEFGEPMVLELGTSLGISTMYMASSCPGVQVYSIEGCPAISAIAVENIKAAGMENVEIITGSFNEVLPVITEKNITPGLVFIDGDHRKESLISYFEQIARMSDSKTVVIIDDINYSKEMEEAWNEIKRNTKISLTLDIFRMGLVFFREGINHNNYIIKY